MGTEVQEEVTEAFMETPLDRPCSLSAQTGLEEGNSLTSAT
jgi:hypothetical protein